MEGGRLGHLRMAEHRVLPLDLGLLWSHGFVLCCRAAVAWEVV